jgi:hypothetical protein
LNDPFSNPSWVVAGRKDPKTGDDRRRIGVNSRDSRKKAADINAQSNLSFPAHTPAFGWKSEIPSPKSETPEAVSDCDIRASDFREGVS